MKSAAVSAAASVASRQRAAAPALSVDAHSGTARCWPGRRILNQCSTYWRESFGHPIEGLPIDRAGMLAKHLVIKRVAEVVDDETVDLIRVKQLLRALKLLCPRGAPSRAGSDD